MPKFLECFHGFEKLKVVKDLFGELTLPVLENLQVEFSSEVRYMEVDGNTGHLRVGKKYYKKGKKIEIYLDVIHELVHVMQHYEGRLIDDHKVPYVDRPIEIEAYRIAVKEARRLGMKEKEILSYLWADWLTKKEAERLAKHCGVKVKKWRLFPRGKDDE